MFLIALESHLWFSGPQANGILIVMGAQGALSIISQLRPRAQSITRLSERNFLRDYGEFALP